MKTQKLGFDDFEAVGTSELLKVKGGKTTLLRVGPGGDGGCCPDCGNPGHRSNGSEHFSGNSADGAYAAGGANVWTLLRNGALSPATAGAFLAGYIKQSFGQAADYYSNFDANNTPNPGDIWATGNGYNGLPNEWNGWTLQNCD